MSLDPSFPEKQASVHQAASSALGLGSLDHLLLTQNSRPAQRHALGFGPGKILFVDTSTLPNAGFGLFSKVSFVPGDAITLYDGIAVDKVHTTFASKDDGTLSHACKVKGTEYVILGLRFACKGRGLGSFANHSNNNNAIIQTKQMTVRYYNLQCCPFLRRCLVVEATANIHPGDEIFVRYSRLTLARLQIPQT